MTRCVAGKIKTPTFAGAPQPLTADLKQKEVNKKNMADRTSAGLFGKIFALLAKNPTQEHKAIAAELWPEIHEYDFNEYQMYCDDALIALDLARNGIDPKHPDDGIVLLYGPATSPLP